MISADFDVDQWRDCYAERNSELIQNDPEFAAWLEEYVPIAGGWQY